MEFLCISIFILVLLRLLQEVAEFLWITCKACVASVYPKSRSKSTETGEEMVLSLFRKF